MSLISKTLALVMMLVLTGTGIAKSRINVYVSIVPQKFFVEQIAGDLVKVHVMVQPGASPATYEPKPKQMAALSEAQIYFAIGVPFEIFWLKKIAAVNPDMKVVPTQQEIEKMPMTSGLIQGADDGHHRQTEQHGAAGGDEKDHGHDGDDPHIWLSPPLVKIQAKSILLALTNIDPAHQETYKANHKKFIARITQLDDQLKHVFTNRTVLEFMVFHPAWGYFAQAYGLKQVPIEIEGKTPKPAQLKALIEHAKERGIKVIFVQPQFSTKSATLIAKETGGQIAFADPLAENWFDNLQQVARKFEKADQ